MWAELEKPADERDEADIAYWQTHLKHAEEAMIHDVMAVAKIRQDWGMKVVTLGKPLPKPK